MLADFIQQLLRSGESKGTGEGKPLSSLFTSLLGKSTEQGDPPDAEKPAPTGLGGLIQAILGEGGSLDLGGTPDLAPFTEALAERTGISTRLASIIVTFAAGLLLAVMQKPGGGTTNSQPAAPADQPDGAPANEPTPGLNLDYLLDEEELVRSGTAARLALRTGLDERTAAYHLRAALALLLGRSTPITATRGGRRKRARGKSFPAPGFDLKNLLDGWQEES